VREKNYVIIKHNVIKCMSDGLVGKRTRHFDYQKKVQLNSRHESYKFAGDSCHFLLSR